jgi:putative intracellular protease/amidase
MRIVLRRLARVLLASVLSLLTFAGVSAGGVTTSMPHANPPTAAPPHGWPAAAPIPSERIRVAVVVGASGSEISDVLAPYEVFASSPAFFVYTVSAVRAPASLFGGPSLLPDHTLAEAEFSAALAPDVVVVPAVGDPTGSLEAPLRGWILRQADRGAHILGVCTGADLLAAAGLLDNRQAASHWAGIGAFQASYPRVRWVRGQRYVQDGAVTTTAGLTSGIPGALRLVEQFAGATEAKRVGKEIAYPGWSLVAPTSIPTKGWTTADLPMALNFAFPWLRPTVGIKLVEGVGEIDLAAAFDVHNLSASARAVSIPSQPMITTRHGVVLLAPTAAAAAPRLDRLVVPGAGFDAALRDLASHTDRATASVAAKYLEYPAAGLQLTGDAWPWRPTALLVLALVAAIGVGLLPSVIRLGARRRRAAARAATGIDDYDANLPPRGTALPPRVA